MLDSRSVRESVFVGHSIAGSELSKIAEVYPERVKKLVYLDALDNASGGWSTIPQPPPAPEPTARDLESVQSLAAAFARSDGYRKPLAAICNMIRTDPSGKVVDGVTPPEIIKKVYAGLQQAQYDRIKAPVLGILNAITPQYRLPYYSDLNRAGQEEFDRSIRRLSEWTTGAIERFRAGLKNSRVVLLRDSNHYAFITEEPLVVREVRKFLLEEGH